MTGRDRLPWFPFDAAGWLAASEVRLLTLEERGALMDLRCHAWRDGFLPPDLATLARLLGVPLPRFRRLWEALSSQFIETPQGWTHPAIEALRERQMASQERRTEHGRKAAAARWNRKDRGQCSGNARAMPGDATQDLYSASASQSASSSASLKASFDRFWMVYPRRVKRVKALAAWRRLAPDAALEAVILAAVEAQARSDQWTRDGGAFIPHPTTWLEARRWEDEVPAPASRSNGRENAAPGPDAYRLADSWCEHDPRCASPEVHALMEAREAEDAAAEGVS